jgi:hypothetical protein
MAPVILVFIAGRMTLLFTKTEKYREVRFELEGWARIRAEGL